MHGSPRSSDLRSTEERNKDSLVSKFFLQSGVGPFYPD
jgi:hypothetical protein